MKSGSLWSENEDIIKCFLGTSDTVSQILFVVVISSFLADLSYSFSIISKTLRNLLFVYDNSCFGSFFHRLFGGFFIILILLLFLSLL